MPTAVFSCEADGTNKQVESCQGDQVCSVGRCVSPRCQAGEIEPSITGCLFYTATLDNVDADDIKPTLIVVTNAGDTSAMVQLQERGPDLSWTDTQSITIDAGSAGSFTIIDPTLAALAPDGAAMVVPARRVVSDTPVTAMIVQSDNADLSATSSSGTMLLPVHSLGTQYMVMTYQQKDTDAVIAQAGARCGAAELSVVATQDHTTIWIYPPSAPPTVSPMAINLVADGDIYSQQSTTDGDDLSGAIIVANKRVAVFSGNVTTTYSQMPDGGIFSADMAAEQMVPTGTWSHRYVAARLEPQSDVCTTLFSDGTVSYWRVLASQDAMVSFASAPGKPLLPGLPPGMTHLTRGSPFTLLVASPEDFVVHSDVPILVTQGMDCEPTLASAIPADAPSLQQVFTLAPNFDHMLAIARKNDGLGTPVMLDDADITSEFTPVTDGFEVAHIHVPICYGPVDRCVHRLTGAFGLTLRGMDVSSSYSTTFPSWVKCTDVCGGGAGGGTGAY